MRSLAEPVAAAGAAAGPVRARRNSHVFAVVGRPVRLRFPRFHEGRIDQFIDGTVFVMIFAHIPLCHQVFAYFRCLQNEDFNYLVGVSFRGRSHFRCRKLLYLSRMFFPLCRRQAPPCNAFKERIFILCLLRLSEC
jgi:hypothetical protein